MFESTKGDTASFCTVDSALGAAVGAAFTSKAMCSAAFTGAFTAFVFTVFPGSFTALEACPTSTTTFFGRPRFFGGSVDIVCDN